MSAAPQRHLDRTDGRRWSGGPSPHLSPVRDEASYRRTVRLELSRLERLLVPVGLRQVDADTHARRIVADLGDAAESYGFEAVKRAATLVRAADSDLLPARLLGFVEVLRDVLGGGRGPGRTTGGWLVHAGGPYPEHAGEAVAELAEELSLSAAWSRAADILGIDQRELAERIGERIGVGVADLSEPSRLAARLVPVSLMEAAPLLPLEDRGDCFVAAAADPTSLSLVSAIERITGRTARLEVAPPEALRAAVGGFLDASAPAARGSGDGPRRSGAELDRASLLVADDEPATLRRVRALLLEEGYVVKTVASGPEAVEIVGDGTSGLRLLILGRRGGAPFDSR